MLKIFIGIFLLFCSVNFYPQSKNDNLKYGVQFNILFPSNEFPVDKYEFSWLARGSARFGLADYLNGEVGAGYGIYTGNGLENDNYKTQIYPIDFRLLIKITKAESYPYIMLGAGIMYYDVINIPQASPSRNAVKLNGFAGIAPAGIGYQFAVGGSVHLDINAGITFTSTDNLNYFKDGDAPDIYFFSGISLLLGSNTPRNNDYDDLFNLRDQEVTADIDNPDTDMDSLSDDDEIIDYISDPLVPDDDTMKIGKPIVLEGINFEFNSAEITPESMKKLEGAYLTLLYNPEISVEIAGHTDEIGSDNYNQILSQKRADAVKYWLIDRGIDVNRLISRGYGKQKPVAPNDSPENRSLNRRIEFIRIN
jgi:outer membrane protein OmpA-like peptidoglycan-associated protein